MKKLKLFFILPFVLLLSACAGKIDEPPVIKATPQQSVIKITAQQLLGQNTSWVSANLGQPAFKRSDGQAELWQYKSAECVLSIFIYEDISGGQRRVLHFDGRDLEGKSIAREICLNSL
ncbi:MAG: hypothetical protein KAQ66_09035 [Rhodospirillaceae bacterium]|nr:hypothetical protein [Rhodospirillaceae bacterium]